VFGFNGDGKNNQQRHLMLFQSDLTKQLKHKFKIESGVKSTFQTYRSDADYYVTFNNNRAIDSSRLNGFNYTESINAVYLQGSKTLFWEILLKVGARLEHTYMNGNQTIPSDTSFTINRVDWFPYVYLSRPIFKIADFEVRSFLIYRRTISRPNYQNLNPYRKYIDQFQFETGNPSLLPQFTDNIELNVSFDDHPLFAVGRNYTKDIFSGVVYPDQSNSSISVRTFDNIGTNVETYFRGIAGIPPGKKYFFMLGAQYNINEYDGMYDNQPLKYTRGSWRFFTFHSLTLFKQTKITMNGFMMTNGNFGMYELGTFGALNFGINQTLFKKKMTISLSFRDVLKTMKTTFTMNQGTIYTTGDRYSDNQRIGINIRYNFGIRKKEEKKNMMNPEEEL
jgi:iron complex outermembrane recepter protein